MHQTSTTHFPMHAKVLKVFGTLPARLQMKRIDVNHASGINTRYQQPCLCCKLVLQACAASIQPPKKDIKEDNKNIHKRAAICTRVKKTNKQNKIKKQAWSRHLPFDHHVSIAIDTVSTCAVVSRPRNIATKYVCPLSYCSVLRKNYALGCRPGSAKNDHTISPI